MSRQEEVYIGCPPALVVDQRRVGILNLVPPPGSVEMTCEKCGTPILVGPRCVAKKAEQSDATLICFVCLTVMMAVRGDENVEIRYLDGQGWKYGMDDGTKFE